MRVLLIGRQVLAMLVHGEIDVRGDTFPVLYFRNHFTSEKVICKVYVSCTLQYAKLKKLTTGPRLNFSPSDIKAMLAAIDFIYR